MSFLSYEEFTDHLLSLWESRCFEITQKEPASIDWEMWEDPGKYPNNLADRPLPSGPWYVSRVNGSVSILFSVPRAWAVVANGEPSFKFDDQGPQDISCFIKESLISDDIREAVFDVFREVMIAPAAGQVEDSLDAFRVVMDNVTLTPNGHETSIEIEARLKSA